MGYGITPFRVRWSRIEACFGMADLAQRDKILAACEVRIEKLDEWFDDGTPFEVILRDFLAGQVSYPDEGYKYWYAIELLAAGFGQSLDNNAWYPAKIDTLWELDACKLFLLRTAVPIPSPDDFPTVFVILHATLDAALAQLKALHKDADQVAEFTEWCHQAQETGEDLVLYYY